MNHPRNTQLNEAIMFYGQEVTASVIDMVTNVGDADGVYSLYQDMGMDNYAECLKVLYFEQ